MFSYSRRIPVKRFTFRAFSFDLNSFGQHIFKGASAAPHLEAQGLSASILDNSNWTKDGSADKVAAAVLSWALANGASSYCHWFQPLGAASVRHGQAAQVQNTMIKYDEKTGVKWELTGKQLLGGETDGSSCPSGGMRDTSRAGGYLSIDPTSPIFLRGDVIFIPSCLTSYYGMALDEKTPLHRAAAALSREGVRLLRLLGFNVDGVHANIGLEQELFFVPREAYNRRPDLQFTGRTVVGRLGARGQEMSDHYMASLSYATPALACLQEVQQVCFKMGIPLCTRHREVAPGQYEFAPKHGRVTVQIDQNLVVMQVIEEIAAKHGLVALMQEKPFQGVNGSGKHNNWSVNTNTGVNLLDVNQLASVSKNPEIFPVIMSAIIKAVSDHGDLLRLAIACPGNDFRLGACEAPPSIMSMYLGEDMTTFLQNYANGVDAVYSPQPKTRSLGSDDLPHVTVPSEDRNRTSPFPYGGSRFEFRAVGSSQNVSLVNTVLASVTANAFREFSDAIEKGAKPRDLAQNALKTSFKTVFNGDGYDHANQEMLTKAGVWRIDSTTDAIACYTADKNMALFESLNVLSKEECKARQTVLFNHYIGVVEMEANCLVDMLRQQIIPAVKTANVGHLEDLQASVHSVQAGLAAVHHEKDLKTKADLARKLRLETMIEVRNAVDAAEAVVPASLWPLATYKELLFLDQHIKDV